MSLDRVIRDLAEAGTVAALETHLPALLSAMTQPADPDRLYTYAGVAELWDVPESTVRARVDAGELWTVQAGKHVRIPQRAISEYIEAQRLKAKFKRDQETGAAAAAADLEAEMHLILSPARPARAAKKKARR